ncbi:hypothetical protein KZX46_10940 [Polymorphobacter sp. PAMC 29334]|uniref:hypothetical protein n=1 Tax=Polymorphobacter sp. PAMC 29334 TaxID=2862331 RepID=UPI001C74CABF|nr:hypothetical protein [Polymorphobacter sp. PAMC 29334]QYE36386.1 hypothetical protein KZX46_10940 [Polymorphobacter sp. PAMC 29334]
MSRWGVFGAIDTWQLEVFGSNNVILLAMLSTPLIYVPLVIARPGRINGSTPMLLGMRQAFDNDFGPRIVSDPKKGLATLRTAQRIAFGVMAIGVVVVAAATVKWVHDARSPHARLPSVGYATLIDPATSLPEAATVKDVVADRSIQWAYDFTVRQDAHHDVYYPLRPLGQPATAPVALVERDQTSPQYDAMAVWNMVNAPGAREGVPAVLGTWKADQLRRAGFVLAPRVIVLTRQQLHGRSPDPDPFDNFPFVLVGIVALVLGGLFGLRFTRLRRLRDGTSLRSLK